MAEVERICQLKKKKEYECYKQSVKKGYIFDKKMGRGLTVLTVDETGVRIDFCRYDMKGNTLNVQNLWLENRLLTYK